MTRIEEVRDGVVMLSTYAPERDLTFNQYLVVDDHPLLVHTGSKQLFESVSDAIERVLPLERIEYALITHFESDECGSLSSFLERAPDITPVCSAVTATQLRGFDIHDSPRVVSGGDALDLGSRSIEFIDYPAEMHLWNGLLAYDRRSDLLFSSDLFRRRGKIDEPIVEVEADELDVIPEDRVPAAQMRRSLEATLVDLGPRMVAPGHGPVLSRS